MAKQKILVVDDEEDILELVRYNLAKEGFDVVCASSGEEAIPICQKQKPAVVILDLMLPGVDGLEICRTLKSDTKTRGIPVVMLTAKGEESDIVLGLELGADDYVTKPFSPRVLLARVRAVLRRRRVSSNAEGEQALEIDGLRIDPQRHEVLVHGEMTALTATEFRILHFLARHPGWVFPRSKIVDRVHGEDYPVTDRSIDVQIVGLRKKLGACGELIETVRGVGYRFRELAVDVAA